MRKAIVQLPEAGFDALPDLPARLSMFLDAYGLPDRKRPCRRCKLDLAQELRWLQDISADLARALLPAPLAAARSREEALPLSSAAAVLPAGQPSAAPSHPVQNTVQEAAGNHAHSGSVLRAAPGRDLSRPSQAWRLLGGLTPPRLDAAALRAWSQPGWIKVAMEFRARARLPIFAKAG